MQKGIFVMLVIVAFFLGASMMQHREASAAKQWQYKVVDYTKIEETEKILNAEAKNGWEFVQIGAGMRYVLIFRK